MARIPDMERRRICLDCMHMKHSYHDYEVGCCVVDGHKIDHVNNRSWCISWFPPEWRRPSQAQWSKPSEAAGRDARQATNPETDGNK